MSETGNVTRQIFRQMQEGDRQAFDRFFERNAARVLIYINYNLGSRLRRKIEPADILQNLYLKVYEGFERFIAHAERLGIHRALVRMADHEITEAYRYHFKVDKRDAKREITAIFRGDGVEEANAPSNWTPAAAASLTQRIAQQEEYQRVMHLLGELSPDEQYVTVSKVIEGASTQEVAERLGKTRGAVQMIFLRVRNKLREKVAGEEEG